VLHTNLIFYIFFYNKTLVFITLDLNVEKLKTKKLIFIHDTIIRMVLFEMINKKKNRNHAYKYKNTV